MSMADPSGGAATRSVRTPAPLWAAVVVLAMGLHGWLHVRAGLSLPTPWPDELHFALPALSLLDAGTLHSVPLHPDRPLMWMPPGYAVALAPVYAVFGPSLVAARAVSLVATWLAALALWRVTARTTWPPLAAAATALFVLHPAVVAGGNVARMDALMLALAAGGLACMAADRPWAGAALLALGPLVHPNGLYFLGAGLVVLVFRRPQRPRGLARWALVLVGLLWLAYAAHVASNLVGFAEDMRFQLQRKTARDLAASLAGRHGLVAVAFAAALMAAPSRRRLAWLAALAVPAWLAARVGHEMWYEPLDAMVAVLLLVAVIDTVGRWVTTRRSKVAGALGLMVTVVALGWLLAPQSPRLPTQLRWKGMALSETPYVTAAELEAVRGAVQAVGPSTAEVFPRGDAMLLLSVLGDALVCPVRSGLGARTWVVHRSPDHPRRWRRRTDELIGVPGAVLLHRRDAEHSWWLVTP